MNQRQQDVLRVQPHTIPAVRATLRTALDQLNDALVGLGRQGFIPEPWLGDEASHAVAIHYTTRAMNGPQSSYQLLVAYRDELARVHDTLQHVEDDYRRNEGDDASKWGRMA